MQVLTTIPDTLQLVKSKHRAEHVASEFTRTDDDGWTYEARFYLGAWYVFAFDKTGFELGPIPIPI